ncbi:cob(I)yrinic acid a,c-diamide adenosyltransferase [bacterium]|nr:cob(I)yrinic acid a,c-diamide adenosyltransferase [bacterium]
MVKLSKLYTRHGDTGETGLVGGERVSKSCLQVHSYGEVDELNSFLGAAVGALAESKNSQASSYIEPLREIQQTLFDIGAELATPPDSEWMPPNQVGTIDITKLENDIDQWTGQVEELKSFILPGGSRSTSTLHLARSVCRRAERSTVRLAEETPVRPLLIQYLNRLSDWLFALARVVAHDLGEDEYLWQSDREKT